MAHKARIPSCASAPDTHPDLINAYQLNSIDHAIDAAYAHFRYLSKQVFRNAIKREICAAAKVDRLIDLRETQVEGTMQWLERLRRDAIQNSVASSALEQRFLGSWLGNSRAVDDAAVKAKVAA